MGVKRSGATKGRTRHGDAECERLRPPTPRRPRYHDPAAACHHPLDIRQGLLEQLVRRARR